MVPREAEAMLSNRWNRETGECEKATPAEIAAARVKYVGARAAFPRTEWEKFKRLVEHFCHENSDGEPTRVGDWTRGIEEAVWEMGRKS